MPYPNPTASPEPGMFDDGPPEKAAESESPGEGQTALLPKSILAGKEFKPGDEVVLKIVNLHENDVEVEYASEEPEKQEGAEAPAETPPAEAAPAGGGMASMME